jgi:peptidoglycan/xylan/chitin deacetylase (PgdA/CDA1 family)
MRLDRLLTMYVSRPVSRLCWRSCVLKIPILMYHSISKDSEPGVSHYFRVATGPERFHEQMRWLREHDYVVIDVAEALRRLEAKAVNPDRCVVLTFDDGYHDFLTHAWPILREFGYPATVFLPTAFIGRSGKCFKGRRCLSWEEVRELQHFGVSFGSHTVSHPMLYRLSWEEIRRELLESRLRLEDELRAPSLCFSYPYAFPQEDHDFVYRFKKELREQGYRAGVTTAIGRARQGSDQLCLKRLPVNDSDDKRLFMAKIAGAYDWLAGMQYLARHAKSFLRQRRP